ncbi:MAG: tRNA 2-thiocytidine biosynthesis TtcA family protein [Spirochaetota bacterium]
MGIERTVSRRIDKAIFGYRLIEPGDRVLVGLSGGKDSVTLAHQLAQKARGFSIPFEVAAVHVRTEYADADGLERLEALAQSVGLPFDQITISVTGRLKPGRRMNCYWCSTQRRTELLRYAEANGFTRIALGHHMDDILETLLMNMTHKGEISTMLPVLRYDNYPQWIIRPLAWVTEEQTAAYAREIGFQAVRCRCGFDETSRRKDVRRVLESIIEQEGEGARSQMMKALHNVQMRYMPTFESRGDEAAASAGEETEPTGT